MGAGHVLEPPPACAPIQDQPARDSQEVGGPAPAQPRHQNCGGQDPGRDAGGLPRIPIPHPRCREQPRPDRRTSSPLPLGSWPGWRSIVGWAGSAEGWKVQAAAHQASPLNESLLKSGTWCFRPPGSGQEPSTGHPDRAHGIQGRSGICCGAELLRATRSQIASWVVARASRLRHHRDTCQRRDPADPCCRTRRRCRCWCRRTGHAAGSPRPQPALPPPDAAP